MPKKDIYEAALKGVLAIIVALIAYVFVSTVSALQTKDTALEQRVAQCERNSLTQGDAQEIKNGLITLSDMVVEGQKQTEAEIASVKLAIVRHDRTIRFEDAWRRKELSIAKRELTLEKNLITEMKKDSAYGFPAASPKDAE